MANKGTILVSLVVLIIIILVVVNLPLMPHSVANICNNSGCSTVTFRESLIDEEFPCTFQVCLGIGNLRIVTVNLATLNAGYSATNSIPANASLSIVLQNPGSTTYIISILLYGGSDNVTLTSWDSNALACSSSNLIGFNSPQNDSNVRSSDKSSSFVFYPESSGHPLGILSGQTYNYVIDFQNGQSVSGSLIAQ